MRRAISTTPILICVACLAIATFCGCLKSKKPTADSIDPSLVGHWEMDREATLKAQMSVLEKAGLFKLPGDKTEFRNNFEHAHFNIDLLADAQFTCSMGNMLQQGIFSGYWKTSGEQVTMNQTHAGIKKESDKMAGFVIDGKLQLIHNEMGISLPYIFVSTSTNKAE